MSISMAKFGLRAASVSYLFALVYSILQTDNLLLVNSRSCARHWVSLNVQMERFCH
jgi:hypothetical protein